MEKLFAHIEKSIRVVGSALHLNEQLVIDLIMCVWRWRCTISKECKVDEFMFLLL
jgi:hypothetical protein